ncbi:sensor histidine kinase [Virgibacillus sp. MSP4-1]|uniref:ATP-binding protein n=1 Tax=Virgibacillus sp. MSP4-1 TaxID=2700081 RepID=UPI00039B5DCE|nr:sensor histidine kinase [Virgibacillus sp. MSP4-1]QHS23192.1 sensor histidine kinase [Virgibacillus sp. MSP4-1]
MSLKQMPIRWKITILSFGVVLFSVFIGGIILIGESIEAKEEELGNRGLTIGRTVANLPEIQSSLIKPDGWNTINPIVERIRTINNASYIVVLNMNRIRFSHPDETQLGTLSSGKDEGPSYAEHSYVSKAQGEVGRAVRSFVPIMNQQHEQIGVVIVGHMMPSIWDLLLSFKNEILTIFIIVVLFGMAGSWLLARHIKEQTYQLEPYEIVQLLVERTAAFQAMNEGIIAMDRSEEIIIFNSKAQEILGVTDDPSGKDLHQVIYDQSFVRFIREQGERYREEIRFHDKFIMCSRVPIKINEEVAGAVVVFQDRTDLTRMAEELTGVRSFVDALRVQRHEHLNQLHTVAGLIQLGQTARALNEVLHITDTQQELTQFLGRRIKDYSIAGLLIGKVGRGKELDISVSISEECQLNEYPPLLDQHDFVLILGNLIENAFAALQKLNHREKWIHILIYQDSDQCQIHVEDNGTGIPEWDAARIFEKGFTTKEEEDAGFGLFLVKNTVEKGLGDIQVISNEGQGTSFVITFPMTTMEEAVK